MNNIPMDYSTQMCTDYFNLQPSQVKSRANISTEFYKRVFYNMLYSVFEFELPKEWKINFFRFFLFHFGSIAVIYTDKFGWICQPYGVQEFDLYYNPKVITVYNRFLDSAKIGYIGINSGLIHLFDDFYGIDDLITRYATKLANIDKSIDINLMNSNVALVTEVSSKKEHEAILEAYSKATEGVPLVGLNENVLKGGSIKYLIPGVKNNYIANDLIVARRTLLNDFLTKIGIRNSNYEKKERLNSMEVNENNDETRSIISVMLDNMLADMEVINKISNLELNVKLRYDYVNVDNFVESVNNYV